MLAITTQSEVSVVASQTAPVYVKGEILDGIW